MDLLGMTFASGWASGLNAYATVLVLGLLGRFLGVDSVPEGFERTDVLVIVGVLALVEFVADKIPVLDSLWDVPSTAIRPIAGAVIGALIAGAEGDLTTITLAAVGGVTALVSHLTKASIRLAVNTSPEPVSNVGASVAENAGVVSVAALAATFPVAAAVVAAVLLAIMIWLAVSLMVRIRRGWRWLRGRFARPGEQPSEGR
jgi:uncharacterized membrane protein